MKDRRVEAFVEAILTDSSPKPFRAPPGELHVIRAAIEQRSRRAALMGPDPAFVRRLHRELSTPASAPRRRPRMASAGLARAAAVALLVASTLTATGVVGSRRSAQLARAPSSATVRSGVLVSADGRTLGRTYAFGGDPSWVFLDLRGSALTGVYTCEFRLVNGTTVPAGVVAVYNGTGDWAHTVGF